MQYLRQVNSRSGSNHVGSNAHVETGALVRPVERGSTAISSCGDSRARLSGRAKLDRLFAVGAIVIMALTSACRLDMHEQPRQNPLSYSDFYSDHRSARPTVQGTVARGELNADAYFYTGKIGTNPGDAMPFPVTKEVLERGQERYNIYCSPCHSRVGDGKGFVPSRGFSRMPPSYHIPRLQKAPLGYFFDVMTNGFGVMPDYASQISPQDRWNIVAYIRALQLSQNATQADVPAGQKIPSTPPKFAEPGSGATLPKVVNEPETGLESGQNLESGRRRDDK